MKAKELPDEQMNISMGGEVGQFVRRVLNKTIPCSGVCFRSVKVRPELVRGYLHSGGLEDGHGIKWWVYVHCDNKLKSLTRTCDYGNSFGKVQHSLDIGDHGPGVRK